MKRDGERRSCTFVEMRNSRRVAIVLGSMLTSMLCPVNKQSGPLILIKKKKREREEEEQKQKGRRKEKNTFSGSTR